MKEHKDIYDKMVEDRVLFLTGDTNAQRCSSLVAHLLYLDSINQDDIKLYIDSPGGSCSAGLSVVDTMRLVKSDVSTVVVGIAASMGSVIASSGAKGKRFILPHSEIMVHQVSSGTSGTVADMRIDLKHAEKTYDKLLKILSSNTGQSLKKLKDDCSYDNWMTAQESVAYGLVDKVL